MLRTVAILACIWTWSRSSVNCDTDADDVSALNVFYSTMNSPGQLTGWNSSGGDPCGLPWKGITCSGSSVTEIKLSSLGLNGNLGYNMDMLKSLVELDMSNNNLGGGNAIPYNLPPNLQRLNLAQNHFTGVIPYSISQMASLQTLNLARNQLQVALPDMFGQLSKLETIDFSSNFIPGDLPESFSSLSSLATLHLQNNQFTGHIDVLANLPLKDLSERCKQPIHWLDSNQLKKINNLQTGGNFWSTGPAPPPPPYIPPPGSNTNPDQGSASDNTSPSSGGKSSGIGGGGIAGIVISILVVGALVSFFLLRRKSRKFSRQEYLEQDQPFAAPYPTSEIKDFKSIHVASEDDMGYNPATDTALFQSAPISVKPPPIDRLNKRYDGDDLPKRVPSKKAKSVPINLTMYSVADLQIATDSFSPDNLVGKGSLGSVYRAKFADGKVLAVKKINFSGNQSFEDFIDLVSSISRLHHPNISELVGYCSEYGQNLLVYEFYKNGALRDQLQLTDEYSDALSWNTRVKIALGTARALEYLHEVCSPPIIHKNFKSANILIDEELNPCLSDCGLANLFPDAGHQGADYYIGAGYLAPEATMLGQYTAKSDVYSFGVVMLELLTGRKSFDSSRPRPEQSLVQWATPQLHDIDALDRMVDPELKGLYPQKSLSRFADVIALCVQPEPEFRPPMSEVVQALVRLVQRASMSKRVLSGDFKAATQRAGDIDVLN
ncbi:hypothetical protein HPP92_026048 [Vanilla planifolia]|uniref:Protein kinase domain-containing protein n=1 Tax=Vanilla planifolia TaxID=51239 RepID=A0A835PK41_VANPL|nr:hypothetical protein HPP92_026321 [Vanilla planifolia]KAG0451790.1 hypothetical protein HPP92_026048 [Vanilla planifolia]